MSIPLFNSYKTIAGYLNPMPVPSGTIRACDNETMFTSEYYIILKYTKSLSSQDILDYKNLIQGCVNETNLYKAPDDLKAGIIDESPDNYHGVYAGLALLEVRIPIKLPLALYRFPQLILMKFAAQGGIPLYARILSPIVALIIGLSCIGTDIGNADARRLSWLLIQALSPHSLLCRIAAWFWYRRLDKQYIGGMKSVAAIYYQPQGLLANPYALYWVDKNPNA